MRRLGMLVMAIILITGCNAMQSNMEEAERLWRETEKISRNGPYRQM